MGSTEAPELDFRHIIEHKDELLKRTMIIREHGQLSRGPISDLRMTSTEHIVLTLEWLTAGTLVNGTETWRQTQKWPHAYGMDLDQTVIRFNDDDSIDIIVRHGMIGKILPASTPPLEEPVD